MCGINGIVSKRLDSDALIARVNDMNNSIIHRGPDSQDVFLDSNVSLGHVRLSIIDLTDSGKQPMVSGSGRYVIVFNGEIYNYKEVRRNLEKNGCAFKTNSDTEVVLEAFAAEGFRSINRLRGMFAFSIYDRESKEIWLVRDRVGIKPVYYSVASSGDLVFSSEIKGIASVQDSLKVDELALMGFIRSSFFTEEETVFKNVRKLKPGHFLKYSISTGEYEIKEYYSIEQLYNYPIHEGSQSYLTNMLAEKLEEAVEYHLVSDVPVGSFLSGGLDSSLITAVMNKKLGGNTVNSNSVVYRDSYEGANEEEFSSHVAELLGTNHTKVELTVKMLESIEAMSWHADEPFGAMSSYALFFLSRTAAKNNKVVLTGDGADEILGGYNGLYQPLHHKFHGKEALFRQAYLIAKPISSVGNYSLKNITSRLLDYSQTDSYNFSVQASYNNTSSLSVLNSDLFGVAMEKWRKNNKRTYYESLKNQSDIRRKTYSLIKTRLVDEMLLKVDRMTMAHSLEARVPFLDHELLEMCIRMPDHMKYNPNVEKHMRNKFVLRQAGSQFLSPKIVERKKQGFNVPLNEWLFKESSVYIESIMEGELVKKGVISKKHFEAHLKKASKPELLFNLLSFEKWYTSYRKRLPNLSIEF